MNGNAVDMGNGDNHHPQGIERADDDDADDDNVMMMTTGSDVEPEDGTYDDSGPSSSKRSLKRKAMWCSPSPSRAVLKRILLL